MDLKSPISQRQKWLQGSLDIITFFLGEHKDIRLTETDSKSKLFISTDCGEKKENSWPTSHDHIWK